MQPPTKTLWTTIAGLLTSLAAALVLWVNSLDVTPPPQPTPDPVPDPEPTPDPLPDPAPPPPAPSPAGPALFPAKAIWNTPIDQAPLHAMDRSWIDIVNGHAGHNLHPDFGTVYSGSFNGIPINYVAGHSTPKAQVTITAYASESDPIPAEGLPIPANVAVEGDYASGQPTPDIPGSDQHCLILDTDTRILHEFYHFVRNGDGTYTARQYSRWDTSQLDLRPGGWTSTDAAGLPVAPLLVRYDEVQAAVASGGVVPHAFRFTLDLTAAAYLWPARHFAGSGGPNNPPMGMHVRLKADVDISGFSPTNQAILRTLKTHGMILADNGGDWFIQGSPDPRWNDDDLHSLVNLVPLNTFEVVDTAAWQVHPDSAAADPTQLPRDVRIFDQSGLGVTLAGNFESRLDYVPGGYAGKFFYAYEDPTPGRTFAAFKIDGLTPGKRYRFAYTWQPVHDFATNAPWKVTDGGTELGNGTLNLRIAPVGLTDAKTGFTGQVLGIFTPSGTTLTVIFGGEANGHVIADAVWVEGRE